VRDRRADPALRADARVRSALERESPRGSAPRRTRRMIAPGRKQKRGRRICCVCSVAARPTLPASATLAIAVRTRHQAADQPLRADLDAIPMRLRTFKSAVLYFVIVLGTGFVLGSIRVPFLEPRLGERYAELLEMPVMLAVIVMAARFVVRRFDLPPALSVRMQVGFAALALSIVGELLLAAALQGNSVMQYIRSRDPVSGSVYVCVLLLFALMPSILARVHSDRARARHNPS
jgi:hypothetical protein